MKKDKYLEAEMEIIYLLEKDIIFASKQVDDGPIEMPFVPRK